MYRIIFNDLPFGYHIHCFDRSDITNGQIEEAVIDALKQGHQVEFIPDGL